MDQKVYFKVFSVCSECFEKYNENQKYFFGEWISKEKGNQCKICGNETSNMFHLEANVIEEDHYYFAISRPKPLTKKTRDFINKEIENKLKELGVIK